ncbi:SDR family NAD(P)-dependent oxidoreductase [Granulicella arctica]|uniref:SDR family NAD(P)-dependent oxidoreductase n=1 Tax=Granulicella arctica TaxID=940613 RepID=UPI0021E04F0C|nr:SDR family oxidoreductase [Granulicella arctica]
MSKFRLDGKRAVITGGASGIGGAIAKEFAENGAQVCIVDLNGDNARKSAALLGAEASGWDCNVADRISVEAAFAAIAKGGPIDILVNSAGVAHVGTLASTTDADFDRVYQVNVRGTYLAMQAALPFLEKSSGTILNMASIAATAGLTDRFAYSMTKGAVLSMTLSVARDYLGKIRCNCISPARVHTPFVDGFVARTYPGHEAEAMARLSAAQPIGRMGQPEEVAMLALYLCSDAAAFVTGVDYPLDGGFCNLR